MKSNTPAFQFYPQDFLVGTAMLSAEETGAYIRLLCYQWTNDGLPNDRVVLSRLAGCDGNAMGSIWDKFGICEDGKLRNKKLEDVKIKQNEYRAKQKANSEKRWKNAENGKVGIPPHIPPHQSGIQVGISQTDALQSSSSIYNIANAILPPVGGGNAVGIPSHDEVKAEKKQVDDAWLTDIKRHYPTTDVDDELRKMDAWLANNPKRRKTRKFIVGWLNRCKPELPPEPKKVEEEVDPKYDFSW